MKSKTLKTLIGGSIAAVMAFGISFPLAASASSASPTNQTSLQYGQLLQYFQTYYTKVATTSDNTVTYVVTPAKPATATPAKPAVTTTAPAEVKSTTGTTATAAATTKSTYAQQVVALVNKERAAAGLSPVAGLDSLNKLALTKATDMRTNNYFSHTSPTYGSPFDMMTSFGITYRAAGENIAMGQRTPEEVMTAWMNSPGHKANILSKNFNYIGVGYDNNYWVQEFIGK